MLTLRNLEGFLTEKLISFSNNNAEFIQANRIVIYYVYEGALTAEYISAKNHEIIRETSGAKSFFIIRPDCAFRIILAEKASFVFSEISLPDDETFSEFFGNSAFVSGLPHAKAFLTDFTDAIFLADTQNVRFTFNNLKQYYKFESKNVFMPFQFDLDIKSLFIEILKCYRNHKECAERNTHMRKALAYINTYFYRDISTKALADYLNISVSYLQRIFQHELGTSVHASLNGIRVERACTLISKTNFSLDKIGKEVGYKSVQAFINNFKKVTGITPGEYKKAENRDNYFTIIDKNSHAFSKDFC